MGKTLHYDKTKTKASPFPPDTKAFLYYSISPGKPRIAGELRLRVTSINDSASFESGSDVLRPDGRSWSRSIYYVSKYFPPLYQRLKEDGLIPDDLHKVLAALPSKLLLDRQVLYTLNDTFIVDFSHNQTTLTIITERGGLQTLQLRKTFTDSRGRGCLRPYTGAYTNKSPSLGTPILIMNL